MTTWIELTGTVTDDFKSVPGSKSVEAKVRMAIPDWWLTFGDTLGGWCVDNMCAQVRNTVLGSKSTNQVSVTPFEVGYARVVSILDLNEDGEPNDGSLPHPGEATNG